MPLAAGVRLGNVVLREPLGKGGMGEVWLGENTALGSEVAVKVLHQAGALDDGARARFEQEARGVAQLNSPHVVSVFDYGVTDDGEPYIVMERLVGRDLKSYIQEQGPLPCELTLVIMRQLCRALRYAHERGVLHRDIKPANIFIVEVDGEPFVKVLDFGLAKYRAADLDLTASGQLMGTPYYMSPEQFMSPRDVDHRTDLWSASVVAYACLVGKLPFLGDTAAAISIAAYTGDYELPTRLRPSLPQGVDAFVARAFAQKPDERFPDADSLIQMLERSLEAEPTTRASRTSSAASDTDAPPQGSVAASPASSDTTSTEITAVMAADDAKQDASLGAARLNATLDATTVHADTPLEDPQPTPSRHRLLGVGGAALALGLVAGILWFGLIADEPQASPDAAPEPSTPAASVATHGQPVADVETPRITAMLRIEPATATVRLNGHPVTLDDGAVMVRGEPGESFVVDVAEGARHHQETVVLKRDGEAAPALVSLPAAPAAPGVGRVPPPPPPAEPPPPPEIRPREDWE